MKFKYIDRIGLLLIFLSLLIYIIASFYQPLIGDDYNIKFSIINSSDLIDYFYRRYTTWGGRFFQNLSSYYILNNDLVINVIRIINIPIFIFSIWMGWYCAAKEIIKYNSKNLWKFISFLSIVWLSTPSINENVFWLTGSITWLYPFFFGMIYLSIFFNTFYNLEKNNLNKNKIIKSLILIISGFIAGSSIEQLSVIILIVSLILLYN